VGLRRWSPLCGASAEGMDCSKLSQSRVGSGGGGAGTASTGEVKADQSKPNLLRLGCSFATH